MVDSIVSSAVQWIGNLLIQEGATLLGMEDQIRSLQTALESIQPYLQDADAKLEDRRIGALVRQTRELVYDAEDVIDIYILKVEAKTSHRKRMLFLKPARFLYKIVCIRRVGRQIQAIMDNLKEVTDKFNSYGVHKTLESYRVESYRKRKPRSYAYDDDIKFIVGWEKDSTKLVEMLVGEGKTYINFISIVGMGGSGKTTLARKLYNHPYVKDCFNYCAWVFVSQESSTQHVLSQILRKVGGPEDTIKSDSSVDELVDKLRGILEKRSYMIVLDDVWNKQVLCDILPALPREKSKIIITTRNKSLVQFITLQQNQYIHETPPLNDEESWELFSKIVFNDDRTTNNMESLENLAKEMLKKCHGLPLAIVALSGILRTKHGINEWQEVNRAVRLKVMESDATHKNGKVRDMLALSYDDLPYHLKPCFLYLSVFPEDCQIPVGMLVRMWIAEGLVTSREGMSLEEVAIQHVEELSQHFMVQIARTNLMGEIKAIRLHDLLRDISIEKSK